MFVYFEDTLVMDGEGPTYAAHSAQYQPSQEDQQAKHAVHQSASVLLN
jgi:hypothetical protein